MKKLNQKDINQIINLRKHGHSLPEIKNITRKSSATILKYIKNVEILPKYFNEWKLKRGGSKFRADKEWIKAYSIAQKLINSLNKKEKLLIAACLYWGEGTKKELSLTNTDPDLIRVFIESLKELGIAKDKLRITIRIYEDINREKAIEYWAKIIKVPKSQILNVNILKGKKTGKLEFGMCRLRITKSAPYFKIIQSIIKLIKENI
ncbi:MAG: hypothetical protein M1170_02420 [Patescibacteria group bacterium]|nr:hypothetical protein [Patescibacteria group bacterium]